MDPRAWSFDIDRYLNPFVPCPPWRHVPYPVARFMGYRKPDYKPLPLDNLLVIFSAFVGVFCGIAVIGVVVLHVPEFQQRSVPLLISSFVSYPSLPNKSKDKKGVAEMVEAGRLREMRKH